METWTLGARRVFRTKLIENFWNVYFTFISCYWSKLLGQVSWQWKMGISSRALQPSLTAVYRCLFVLKKQIHYFVNKGPSSQCESWTIKKAEHRRIDAFELWCWRRLLRVPWTARRSNQSILKEISPEYSLEGLMLKWPPDEKNWLIWKDLDVGKDWRQEEKGMTEDELVGWHHWLDGHEFE